MPTFQYTALNTAGERVAGALAGASEQAVLAELEARRLTPVLIEAQPESASRAAGSVFGRVSTRRLAQTYTQLADLLRAGVPLMRGLKLLAGRKSDPRLGQVFRQLAEAVAEGSDLAEAMAKRPEVFPKVHIAMVRAGEKGGFLEAVLARLGQFLTAQAELRGKVLGSLIYPAVLVIVGAIVLGIIFGVFVPMFEPLLDRIRDQLPFITRAVFALSKVVGAYGPITLGVLVVAGIVLWRLKRRPGVQRTLVELQTFGPIVGPLTRSLAAARFCRLLGTMLGNGIPMLAALQIAREAAGNQLMEEAIEKATEAVRAGAPLAPPLAESGLFSDDVVEMISVGESANNLDDVLVTIAATIEDRIDRLLTTAVRLVEPLLLLALAGIVVLVAIALVLPMTQLSGAVG